MTTARRTNPSQEEVRRQNLAALLRRVRRRGEASRAELTADLGLNRSTIGALTADLTAAGLVREDHPVDNARGRAGRPSLVVRADSRWYYTYAVSVEVDRIRAARVGLDGTILDRRQLPRARDSEVEHTARPLAELLRDMHSAVLSEGHYLGCGVAVCGMVRRADGMVRLGPHTGWVDEPFAAKLRQAFGGDTPVTVDNVAKLSALAESHRGAAVGMHNVVYLYGDVGVGAGILTGGEWVSGAGGYGGEVGHMVVRPDGEPCGCGSRGCWETEIGEHALLRAAGRTRHSGREAVLEIVEGARRGDAAARFALREVGEWLGFGVANLVNVFNPEMVLFAGTLRDVYLASAATVRSRLNSMGLSACREHLKLRTPELGEDAPLIGAAERALEPLLNDPLAAV